MSPATAVRLVAARELRERARRRLTWVVMGVILLGSTALVVVPAVVGGDGTRYRVAVVGDDGALRRAVTALAGPLDATIDVVVPPAGAPVDRLVEDDEVDAAVIAGPTIELVARSGSNEELVGALRQAATTATLADRLGVAPDAFDRAVTEAAPTLREVDADAGDRRGAAFVVSLVLYLLLLSLMVQVANGVAIEKANRISEVLLPVVRPAALLFGKVIGVGVSGVVFLACGVVPLAIGSAAGGDLPAGLAAAAIGGAPWFVLGLALWLTVAGALGALVERPEDAGSTITPLTMILVGTFLVAQISPDSALGSVLALVPFTSPLLVPTRVAVGAAGPWELAGSLVLLAATLAVIAAVGVRIYGAAIVRTGAKVSLRQLRTG